MSRFTHFDDDGQAVMVDVSDKDVSERIATAKGSVEMRPETLAMIEQGLVEKGDVLAVARLAGIMGAKRTSELIPLCHPLSVTSVRVELETNRETSSVEVTATCKLKGRTGVEMEALTAVSTAALTVYDMCKAVDRGMRITSIRLVYKSGGKSNFYEAS